MSRRAINCQRNIRDSEFRWQTRRLRQKSVLTGGSRAIVVADSKTLPPELSAPDGIGAFLADFREAEKDPYDVACARPREFGAGW